MTIYKKEDNYTIFMNIEKKRFFVKMKNKNSLEEKIFTSSEDAIKYAKNKQ